MMDGYVTTHAPPSSIAHLPMFSDSQQNVACSNDVIVEADYNPRLLNGVVVAALMVVGVVGNSLVLYVYHFKLQRTVFSTFVTVLALLDFVTALVEMPIDVVIKTVLLDKTAAFEAICKVAHLEVYSASIASGSVLLLITYTRYNKVCHPLKPGLTVRKARLLCALIVGLAVLLCLVTLVTNGVEEVKVAVGERDYVPGNTTANATDLANNTDITTHIPTGTLPVQTSDHSTSDKLAQSGSSPTNCSLSSRQMDVVKVNICRTSKHMGTPLFYAMQAVLFTAFFVIFIALLVLHCFISRSLAQFERRRSSMRRASIQSDSEHQNMTHITASMFRIFATINIIFVVSYLPHLVCLIVEKTVFKPGEAIPQATRMVRDLAYNFPYINVVANPFIYGYRSQAFRRYCLDLLCRCCPFCCAERCYN